MNYKCYMLAVGVSFQLSPILRATTIFIPGIAGQFDPNKADMSTLTVLSDSTESKLGANVSLGASPSISPPSKPEVSEAEKAAQRKKVLAKQRERDVARENALQAKADLVKKQKELASAKTEPERKEQEKELAVVVKNVKKAIDFETLKIEEVQQAQAELNYTNQDLPLSAPSNNKSLVLKASGQYASKFYFRGLDILDRVSPDDAPSGITASRITLDYADGAGGTWQAGFGYIEALDQQLTNDAARSQPPNLVGSDGKPDRSLTNNQNYRVPSRERYSEADFNLNYSRQLFGGLAGNVGAGYYRFADAGWWGDKDTTELTAGLIYPTRWATLSSTYSHDIGAFDGGLLEFGATGKTIPLWQRQNSVLSLSMIPKARVSYDFKYNGTNNGWNNAQFGLDFPIRLTKNLALILGANYSKDLGDASGDGSRRTDDGFWITATLSAGDRIWPQQSSASGGPAGGKSPIGGKDPVYGKSPLLEKAQLSGWRLSGGVSNRAIDSSLSTNVSPLIRAENLFNKRYATGSDQLADGSSTVVYANGQVNDRSTGGDTQGAATYSGGTSSGTYANRDQQTLYTSQLYAYRSEMDSYATDAADEDSRISPYVRLDREIWRKDKISLSGGLSYSYTSQEMDSGTQLDSVDHFYETVSDHYFLYNGSNQLGGDRAEFVIVDDTAYQGNPFVSNDAAINGTVDRSPQHGVKSIETERTKVATFVQTGLDISMHSLSLPIALTLDMGERLHLSLEVGPTLNIFNYDLRTDAWAQQLENTSGSSREQGRNLSFRGNRGIFGSTDFVESNTSGGKPGNFLLPVAGAGSAAKSTPTTVAALPSIKATTAQGAQGGSPGSPSGGKGANVSKPFLPGKTVAHRTWEDDGTKFQFGASIQTGLQYDLNDADTWFIDVWGRYDYVSPFSISNGASSAEIDASAWSIGAGLGYRF